MTAGVFRFNESSSGSESEYKQVAYPTSPLLLGSMDGRPKLKLSCHPSPLPSVTRLQPQTWTLRRNRWISSSRPPTSQPTFSPSTPSKAMPSSATTRSSHTTFSKMLLQAITNCHWKRMPWALCGLNALPNSGLRWRALCGKSLFDRAWKSQVMGAYRRLQNGSGSLLLWAVAFGGILRLGRGTTTSRLERPPCLPLILNSRLGSRCCSKVSLFGISH